MGVLPRLACEDLIHPPVVKWAKLIYNGDEPFDPAQPVGLSSPEMCSVRATDSALQLIERTEATEFEMSTQSHRVANSFSLRVLRITT